MKSPKRSACNVLRTEVVDPGDEQRLWSARQSFFFKPIAGYGGCGACGRFKTACVA